MREGSGLVEFSKQFPDRYYDVAIAEQHSVWESGGDKIGSGYVEVVPPSERDISGLEIMQLVTEVTQDIPSY